VYDISIKKLFCGKHDGLPVSLKKV